MNEEKNLEKLFIDEEEVSRDLLYDILAPYIRFSKKTNDIIPTRDFLKLKTDQKILVTLAAIKALFVLGKRDDDKIAPKELEKLTGIKGNTLRPVLKNLYDQRIILKDPEGGYYLPPMSIPTVKDMLKHEDNK